MSGRLWPRRTRSGAAVRADAILEEIFAYCRREGMAESTFGRRAVNDGKFVNRLRSGGKVNEATAERVRDFIRGGTDAGKGEADMAQSANRSTSVKAGGAKAQSEPEKNFRFYDNRQKYLMFVNTCSEKWVVAERAARELDKLDVKPPAVRFFDAGMGDGTVLALVMRAMHERFPRFPFYIAGKEISLEDVRLTLDKMPDRFLEHPEMVLAITNISYAEAPWLTPRDPETAKRTVWREVA